MQNKHFSYIAMVLGGLMLVFASGAKIPSIDIDFEKFGKTIEVKPTLEGSTMIFVLEKQTPTMLEVMHIREAAGFVHDHKLAGYLVVDDDDEWAKPLIDQHVKTKGDGSPFIAFCEVKDGKIVKVLKFAAWGTDLEETLK